MEEVYRYKMTIQYKGTNFSGYQVQPNKRTVQNVVENALHDIFCQKVKIYASGRTDARVHALAQVVHFDVDKNYLENRLLSLLNSKLPVDVRALKVEHIDKNFDARFDVKSKTYIYKFYLSRFEKPLYDNLATRVNDNINIEQMKDACKYLLGEHDFKSFVAKKSGKSDFVRTIYSAKISTVSEDLFEFEISANGFLYNMVRIIFGTLIEVGSGRKRPQDILDIINAKCRNVAGKTFPPDGLYLKSVEY